MRRLSFCLFVFAAAFLFLTAGGWQAPPFPEQNEKGSGSLQPPIQVFTLRPNSKGLANERAGQDQQEQDQQQQQQPDQKKQEDNQAKGSPPYGITIQVLAEDDADDKFFKQFSERVKKLSAYIWRCTEGNFYIDSCTLTDKTKLNHEDVHQQKGAFIIRKGSLNRDSIPGMGAIDAMAGAGGEGTDTWWVDCAGRPMIDTLCHETFHGIFLTLHCGESFCIMKPSSRPNEILNLCDDSNHKPSKDKFPQKESCWSLIKKKFPEVKRLAKGAKPGKIPDTKFTVNNK